MLVGIRSLYLSLILLRYSLHYRLFDDLLFTEGFGGAAQDIIDEFTEDREGGHIVGSYSSILWDELLGLRVKH